MRNFYYALSFLFSFTNHSHAILIGEDEAFEESSKATNNIGSCQVCNIGTTLEFQGNEVKTKINSFAWGNGVILDLGLGSDALGMTAAHCLQTSEDNLSTINILLPDSNTSNLKSYESSHYWCNPEFYDSNKKNSADDVGFFHLSLDPQNLPSFFKGDFFENPLQDQQVYDVRVHSFGPSFNNKLTAYRNQQYHEVPMQIIYDTQEKLFHKISKSRDFYFIFSPEGNGSYSWRCDLLPMPGDVTTIHGDSGSSVTTSDGRALALVSARNFDEFYQSNQKLASELLNFKNSMQNKILDENQITDLVSFINTKISDPKYTFSLETADKKKIYRFTLKEEFDSIISKERFTPLAPYLNTFKQLSINIKDTCTEIQKIDDLIQQLNTMNTEVPGVFLNQINQLKEETQKSKNQLMIKKSLYFDQLKKI